MKETQTSTLLKVDERLGHLKTQFSAITDHLQTDLDAKFKSLSTSVQNFDLHYNSTLTTLKSDFTSDLSDLKLNMASQLQSLTTVNQMVTKIIDEQQKTNRAVGDMQRDIGQLGINNEEIHKKIQNLKVKEI